MTVEGEPDVVSSTGRCLISTENLSSACPAGSSFVRDIVATFVARRRDRLARIADGWLTLGGPLAMCPPVRATGCELRFAGQELNIAQHARRQAARKAALVPRFFC